MSQRRVRMYVEGVSGTAVTLEKELNDTQGSGVGIESIALVTTESTAEAGFWGTTGSCAVFEVIFRKVQ